MDAATRLKLAMNDTTAEQVMEAFENMRGNVPEHDLGTMVHAMVVAIGLNNEKLGGHLIVSLRDVLAELTPKKWSERNG